MIETEDYDEFMEWYENEHALCPKCGSSEYITTLAVFILNFNDLEGYKDMNKCTCVDCKDIHKRHNRVKIFNI